MSLQTITSKFLFLLALVLISSLAVAQCPIQTQCGNLAVQGGFPAGGNTFFCEGEVVTFQNTTDPSQVDTTIINWGDGHIEVFTDDLDYEHIYDFGVDTCLIGGTAIIPEITMTVINSCDEGVSVNCVSTFVQIKVDPVALFSTDFQACVGELISFSNMSCVNGEEYSFLWNFGGQGTSTEENPTFTFDTAADDLTVTLTVTNECGEDTYTQIVNVLNPPTAVVIFDADTTACSPHTVTFTNNSTNGTSYHWEITHNGSEVFDSIAPNPTPLEYTFNLPGTYIISMEVNSICGNESWEQLFTIQAGPIVNITPQNPTCETFFYTPDVTYSGGDINSYSWNFGDGNPTTSNEASPTDIEFPSNGPHPVSLTITSDCEGAHTVVDTFIIIPQEAAQISFGDTTICSLDGVFTFTATPEEGGEWRIDGILFDGTIDPENYEAGTYEISYGLDPCITTDRMNFTIVKADIDMPDDREVCLDDSPVTFTATPPGGTWSGTGVATDGVFDPTMTGLGLFTLYYEVINTDLPSCSNIDSFQVTVSELHIDFEVTSCEGNTLCFDTINTSDFTSISWNFGGQGTSSQVAPCFTFPNAQSYVVTATIEGGACSTAATHTVAIEPPPVANFSLTYSNDLCSPLAVSFENNSTGGNMNYEWLLNGEVFSNQETPTSIILEAFTQDTLFEIRLNVSNDCATDIQSESILVHPQPISIFSTDQDQYCSGDTIPLANISTGNPDAYEWYLNGNLISTDSIEPIIVYQTGVVDTIEICLATANTCGTDTLCLKVEIMPTDVEAFFHTSPVNACVGDTVWFTNFATPGVPVFYDFGDNNSSSVPNPFHIYQDTGTYLIVQQAFGCGSDTYEKMVEIYESPTASWTNPTFGCPHQELFFENISQGVMIYEWDFGDGSPISQEESPHHSFTNFGLFDVCLTIYSSDADGCSNTHCQVVEIYEPPVAGFTATDSLCLGDTTVFTSTASDDVTMCDYRFGDDNLSSICNPTHTYATAGTFVVTQIVENQNLCKDTIAQQVFVRSLPIPDFDFQLMGGCHPDSVSFTNLSQNSDSYQWTFGDGHSSLFANPVHYYENAGTYTVTLIASIDNICTAQVSKDITIDETPQAIFTPDTPTSCAELQVTFNNNSTGTFTQQRWDFGDGSFSYENPGVHTYETPGIYQVQLIVNNEDLCADTLFREIEIFEAINASFSTTDLRCFDEPTGAIDVNMEAGAPPFEYNWSNGNVTEDINQLSAGSYQLTITDNHNCNFTTSFDLSQPTPVTAEVVDESVVSCFGGNDGTLTIAAAGGTPDYNYQWETGDSGTNITAMVAGDYTVSITDNNGCIRSFTFPIAQNKAITVADSVENISCYGYGDGEITIDSIIGGIPLYHLTLQGPVNYESTNQHFGELLPGDYTLTIEDAEGCLVTFDYQIDEPDIVFVDIIPDSDVHYENDTAFIKLGEKVHLTTNYNADNPVFEWNPSRELDCNDCYNPTATPFGDVAYKVLLTDKNGCIATDATVIIVNYDKEAFFPTAFTPNDDGHNDEFRIRSNAKSIVSIKKLIIYDRWGEVVFRANDYPLNDKAGEWDGRFPDGKEADAAVYTYFAVIEFINGEEVYRGNVTLLR